MGGRRGLSVHGQTSDVPGRIHSQKGRESGSATRLLNLPLSWGGTICQVAKDTCGPAPAHSSHRPQERVSFYHFSGPGKPPLLSSISACHLPSPVGMPLLG